MRGRAGALDAGEAFPAETSPAYGLLACWPRRMITGDPSGFVLSPALLAMFDLPTETFFHA